MSKKLTIATMDTETDPFRHGRFPKAFCCGIYTDAWYREFWGPHCIDDMMMFLDKYPDPLLIFVHNGGKFDLSFMAEYIDNPIRMINSRIAECRLFHHTVRDSFCIVPLALAAFQKTKIDYRKFEAHCREKHKNEILRYLADDCRDLFMLVSAFCERFGRKLTVASTAMQQLRKIHSFERMPEHRDRYFRDYYFGGRVECFASGVVEGPVSLFDVNSEYPKAMRDFLHPLNDRWNVRASLPDLSRTFFAKIEAENNGALPMITESGELRFDVENGVFNVCSHELRVAVDHGLVKVRRVIECYEAQETIRFDAFVDKFYEEKATCKRSNDKLGEIFAKLMLNSAYGKFGQNPREYHDYHISFDEFEFPELVKEGYTQILQCEKYRIWARPATVQDQSFYDVSIAASITSAARSILLSGMQQTEGLIYCDTDSLMCQRFTGDIDDYALGAWKHELTTDYAVICGKKLYGMFNGSPKAPRFVKAVSKGGRICPVSKRDERDRPLEYDGSALLDIARGNVVEFENEVPSYSWVRKAQFVNRRFKMTAKPSRACNARSPAL